MSVLAVDSAPVPASAGFGVSFVGMDGGRRREFLSSCWMEPFERVLPVRAFGSHAVKKRFSGLWWRAPTAKQGGYEASPQPGPAVGLHLHLNVVDRLPQHV